jgi:hypothetical protein
LKSKLFLEREPILSIAMMRANVAALFAVSVLHVEVGEKDPFISLPQRQGSTQAPAPADVKEKVLEAA